jgi:hypothetical protein
MMHKTYRVLLSRSILAFTVLFTTSPGIAFEVATHAAITDRAWQRALTEKPGLLQRLGFLTPSDGSFPALEDRYFDVSQSAVHERVSFPFETNLIERTNPDGLDLKGQASRVNGWLMKGAIREDDNPTENNPKDDPYQPGGAIHREFNHFFDPYNDLPLTVTTLPWSYGEVIRKAVDWAVGTSSAFSNENTRDTRSTWNHFTLFDAREAMFRALTLKQRDAFGSYTDLPIDGGVAVAELTRKAYWATTFRALGDIVHLNQDMAQPQHTRNETHSGQHVLEYLGAGHVSEFEKYMDERVRRVPLMLAGGGTVLPPPLPFDGYPTPSFEHYSDFWSTSPGPNSASVGKGMADYSNAGFFTPMNNYGDTRYPNPASISYPVESAVGILTTRPDVTVRFLRGDVNDRYTGAASNIRLTTESVWNGRLTFSGTPVRTYRLNRVNYDDMASLLIPRAVGYSAGLIEHFFRGEMKINLPDAGFYGIVDHAKFAPGESGDSTDVSTGFKGFDKIKLKISNATPRVTTSDGSLVEQPMQSGVLIAVLKFHRNLCYDDLLTQWPLTGDAARECRAPAEEIVTSDIIPNQSVPFASGGAPDGMEVTFMFSNRELPINAWDVVLQVVYRGQLGSEGDAVVVATKDIAEPTFAGFMNTSDYVVINKKFYTPAEVAAQQALFASVYPTCRSGQVGSYTVSTACYNRIDSFTFTTGSNPVSIIAADGTAIHPRRLARLALLADPDVSPRFGWQVDGVSCWMFLGNPLLLQPYPAEMDGDQAWTYGRPSNIRSVKVWDLNVCYADIGIQATLPDQLDFTQLDDLNSMELEPTPLTINGWN